MDKAVFFEEMAEILNTDASIGMDTKLDDLEEWDSLALINFLVAMRKHTDRRLASERIREAKTVGHLYQIVKG